MDISGISQKSLIDSEIKTQNLSSVDTEGFEDTLKKAMEQNDDKELKAACDELEGYMISMLFKQMKTSMLSGNSIIEKGDYETMFEDMHIDTLSKEMVKAGGMGLSDTMYKQMKQIYNSQMQFSQNVK